MTLVTTAELISKYRLWKRPCNDEECQNKSHIRGFVFFSLQPKKMADELQKQWVRSVLSNQNMQMFPREWLDSEERGGNTDTDTDTDPGADTDHDSDTAVADL
jgi:hypothetical protein